MLSRIYACVSGRLGGSAEFLLKHAATSQSCRDATRSPQPGRPVSRLLLVLLLLHHQRQRPSLLYGFYFMIWQRKFPVWAFPRHLLLSDRTEKKRMSWLPTGANVASVQLHHCCICGCFSVSTLTDDSSCRKKTVWLVILQKQPSVVKISDLQWMKSTYTRRARTCWWRGILKGDACFWKFDIQN